MKTKRREFLKRASVGAIGIAATSIPDIANASNTVIGTNNKTDVKLGIASYSLRKFSLEAIP